MSISLNIGNKTGINPVQNSIVTPKINPNFKELQKDTVDIKENTADKILRENREQNEGKYTVRIKKNGTEESPIIIRA